MGLQRRGFISKIAAAVLTGAIFATGAQARGGRPGQGGGGQGGGGGSTKTLTDVQKSTVFYMYQEEKVARDVYITLGEMYPEENTFAFIQLSEQRHIDAVENLCNKYGISTEGVNEEDVGNFVLPELQKLYDDMVEKGQANLLAALQVGEAIEIKDIKDLEEASVGMPNDVKNVFGNLREGSINHLEAFQRAISRN